ncbi:MAG TPA: sigma-70 family RNA polymerase sigma factor [Anaerolineales bacterium]|nr:sigma-70 family RNA polymerase sigma factor [Anaerolineales bacterium]
MRTDTLPVSSRVALDKQALSDIYERYSSDIFRYACRLLDDNHLAEDCVSDTFHRFLMAVRAGTSIENIRAYLYRVAHNWITDHYRRHPFPPVALEENMHADPEGSPSQLVAQKLERQRMRAALLRLLPEQRQVIELRFVENWSHAEVAQALGRSVEATRALQYRAVEALRQILSE